MHLIAAMERIEMLMMAAILAATTMLMIRIRRYMRRQKKSGPAIVRTDRPKQENPGHHLGLPPDAMKWEVQIHETARDLSAQIDSKMAALGHLIREADRASARLETALEAAAKHVLPPTQAESLQAAAPADAQPNATPTEDDLAKEPPDQPTRDQLYILADYGFDTREISRRLGIPIGEVELILRLRSETEN